MKTTNNYLERSIYIISIDFDDIKVLSSLLIRSGYQVTHSIASENLQATHYPGSPSLILLEIGKSGLDTLDSLRHLKEDKTLCDIPVILFGDQNSEPLIAIGLDLGSADYFLIPIREYEVLTKVKTQIEVYYLRKEVNVLSEYKRKVNEAKMNEARLESLIAINGFPAQTIQDLLDFALDEAIKLTASMIGYIYFYDETKKEFTLNTWSKVAVNECLVVEPEAICSLDKTGIWGEAVRQRQSIMINDFDQLNPLRKGIPVGHVQLNRFLTIPIFSDNNIVAVIGVGNKVEDYNNSDIRQLNLMMDAVWKIVEKKQNEENLLESKELFRTTLYSIGDGVITTDVKGEVKMMNFIAESLTGWTLSEASGKSIADIFQIINEYTRNKVEIPVSRVLREGIVVGLANHTLLIAKDGTERPIADSGAPIKNEKGEIVGVVLVFRDQTKEREIERELYERERKFSTLVSNLPGFVYRCNNDKDWTMSFLSDGCFPITGYKPEDFINNKRLAFKDVILPEFRDKIWEEIKSAIQNRVAFEFEYQLIDSVGSLHWVWERGTGTYSENGELRYLEGFITEITDRKRAEEELAKREFFFRESQRAAFIGSYNYNLITGKWDSSEVLDQIFGISKNYVRSIFGWEDLIHPEDRELMNHYLKEEVLGKSKPFNKEYRIIRKSDGQVRWVNGLGSLSFDKEGNILALMGTIQDISERKKSEDKLIESESRYNAFVDANSDMIFVKDEHFRYLMINDSMARFFNKSKHELLYKTDQELAEYSCIYPCQFSDQKALEAKSPFTIEEQLSDRIYETTKFPILLRDNKRAIGGIIRDVTERKQAAEAIQDERTLLRTLIDNLPDPIYVKDTLGHKIVANKADLENIGVKSEADVIGKTDFELFDFETAQKTFADDSNVIQHGQVIINREEVFHVAEGHPRWLLTTKIPLKNQKGEITGLVGIGHDITGQRKARETIQKLSRGIEQSPSSIVITDTAGNIEYVNPRFTEITGYLIHEVVNTKPRILKEGKLPADKFDELWLNISSGKVWRGEYMNRRKNGIEFPESAVISPILDENKSVSNLLIISEDVTLKKKEEKIRNVIHSLTHDGSISNNLEDFIGKVKSRLGELVDVTNFYLALYDDSTETFSIPFYNDPKDNIEIFKADKTLTAYVLRTKKPFLGTDKDIEKLKKAGLVKSIGIPAKAWLGIPLIAGDKPLGVFAVQSYDNSSAFNKQDLQMLELVAHEISYIVQRIKSETEIKRAWEKAEESDRLKSAFLANMSHEVRTPLNSIIGFSELLVDSDYDGNQKDEFVQHIITSGSQLLNIISDIMDISKIESGEIVIRKSEIPVKAFFAEVKSFHVLKVQEKLLQFLFDIPEEIKGHIVYADKDRLHQVFNNLIGNALKFTSEGYIRVGCGSLGEKIEFYVKDTGIGIAPEYHEKVFDRFRQVETSYHRKVGGNGLGLAISKNLVELMGGVIRVESELGNGSTFYFTIPVANKT